MGQITQIGWVKARKVAKGHWIISNSRERWIAEGGTVAKEPDKKPEKKESKA